MSGLSISIVPDVVDERKKRLRGGRFKDHLGTEGFLDEPEPSPSKSPKRLKGVSSRIEKPYFRLTSAPKVSQVRPLSVLKKSLEHVKNKYMEEEDYSYSCEQVYSYLYPYLYFYQLRNDVLRHRRLDERWTDDLHAAAGRYRVLVECLAGVLIVTDSHTITLLILPHSQYTGICPSLSCYLHLHFASSCAILSFVYIDCMYRIYDT